MPSAAQFAVAGLDQAHGITLQMVKDVPSDKLSAQFPGAANHFLWTYGHLATSYLFFGSCIGAEPVAVPAGWEKLFGMGSVPTGNAGDYPALAELVAFGEKTLGAFRKRALELSDSELAAPCPNGGAGFMATQMAAILTLIWHEGWHSGQLSDTRRAMGLKGVLGA